VLTMTRPLTQQREHLPGRDPCPELDERGRSKASASAHGHLPCQRPASEQAIHGPPDLGAANPAFRTCRLAGGLPAVVCGHAPNAVVGKLEEMTPLVVDLDALAALHVLVEQD
jgi:hypothetical protein